MMKVMKNLVIAVSPDSSLKLLGEYADIIVLDKESVPVTMPFYETVYIRSHFGRPETLPQVYRTETEDIINRAKQINPNINFVDGTDSVDLILDTEDKWRQYEIYSSFMPNTKLLNDNLDVSGFERPIFKNRLSSHGNGVTWNINETTIPREDWLIQESLDITEELRVYVIKGKVYPVGAIRQSKTIDQGTQAIDSRYLTPDEVDFCLKIGLQAPSLDIIGLDIARTSNGKLYLIEVNRSPGFGKFAELTGVNLADFLYDEKL
ncbi:MAG: hypothetical protein JWN28_597 [Candidatus Saccharibacteria bacterium]|nr:hypothetical protein [Candidatus Saccharibacteria bacterium]